MRKFHLNYDETHLATIGSITSIANIFVEPVKENGFIHLHQ